MPHFTIDKDSAFNMKRDCSWWDLQLIGLETVGYSSEIQKTLLGGYVSFQLDKDLFTGRKTIVLNNGGLQNREASHKLKEFFKNSIRPKLFENIPEFKEKFNGKFILHFAEGNLQKIDIITHCCPVNCTIISDCYEFTTASTCNFGKKSTT